MTSTPQHILITGGAGYIGGTVARLLLSQGHAVTIVDNFVHSKAAALPTDATFIEADIADPTAMTRALSAAKFDGVLHFAALIEAGESMNDPGLYFRANTVATLSLLEALVASGTQNLVFSSTAAVYGEPESTPILETARLAPTNPYGESKLLVEQMLAWFHRIHGLRYAALRYFNVAGAIAGYGEAHEPESHLIPIILDVALGRRASISIYGDDYATPDGTCIRDYIHVEDLARAHVLALAALRNSAVPLLYNLGNGRGFSVREVIEAARRVTGHSIPVERQPRRPGDPAVLVASSEKAQHELGWRPAHPTLDDILSSAWTWHRQLHK
ncbi:MAG TPA: UDP-glucose 4-epimerase GalE [Acidobacteriaceae bacterium]